ncbi:MAG: hypothetical protein K9G62_03560 [Alphaproteobacteria bacterium]|nr:hypothetical protein [Alphaproteobacteria bacterium]
MDTLLAADPPSVLGWNGNRLLPEHLRRAADDLGLRITRSGPAFGEGVYSVKSVDGAFNPEKLCPSFVTRRGHNFDLPNLRAFLDFLHQPLRAGTEQALPPPPDRIHVRKRQSHDRILHQKRVDLHRLLRFATTGSVEIPPDRHEELEKESAECHAKTEQAMRDADSWRSRQELANRQTIQSAVPGTGFSPADGFSFSLTPPPADEGPAHKAMREKFGALMKTATGRNFEPEEGKILLTGRQVEALCRAAHEDFALPDLLEAVGFEEDVQKHMDSIARRANDLSHSVAFQQLSEENSARKLESLIRSTSALSPLVNSEAMQEIWKRYHFTEQRDSPLEGLSKEYAIFQAVMETESRKGKISPARMEALAQEFYPLLAFSTQVTNLLAEARTKAGEIEPFAMGLTAMQKSFRTASLAGVALSAREMKDDHTRILKDLEEYLGGGSSMARWAQATGGNALEFVNDVVGFFREHPKLAAGAIAIAIMLYMNSGNNQPVIIADVFSDAGGISVGPNGELIPINVEGDARGTLSSWHYDFNPIKWVESFLKGEINPIGTYKHKVFENLIVDPVKNVMHALCTGLNYTCEQLGMTPNPDSAFAQASQSVIKPVASRLFDVNILQNASHASFWAYMAAKGYFFGFLGARKIFDLLAPLVDLGYKKGRSLGDFAHGKRQTLSEKLLALGEGKNPVPEWAPFKIAPEDREIMTELAEAACERVAMEKTLPGNIRPADIQFHIGGLKKQFRIVAENLAPALRALDRFDLLAEHVAGQAGIGEPAYLAFLQNRIDAMRAALREWSRHGDAEKLAGALQENAQDLIGAELRHTGASTLYEALTGEQPAGKIKSRLTLAANANFAHIKRREAVAERRAALQESENPAFTRMAGDYFHMQRIAGQERFFELFNTVRGSHVGPSLSRQTRAERNTAGGTIWRGMVAAARGLRTVKDFALKKSVLGAAGALTAACVLLDMAGAGNALTSGLSAGGGGLMAGAATTLAFLIYNFWEDTILVHVVSGAMLITLGAGAGVVARKVTKPLVMAGMEQAAAGLDRLRHHSGLDLKGSWLNAVDTGRKIGQKITALTQKANTELGVKLAPARSGGPLPHKMPQPG